MPDIFWAAFGGSLGGGAIAILIEVFRRFADRPLLKCSISTGFRFDTLAKTSTPYIYLEAVNPHSKPVTISTFGLLFKKKEWGEVHVNPQVGCNFPYQLDSGKSLSQVLIPESLLKTLKKDGRVPSDLKWVYFKASSGKVYRDKIPKWIINKLEEEFSKINKG